MKRKNNISAFTLAETLITLVIVGIVAALTVPNLIVKHRKEETVTRLKKAYSTVYQAVKMSEIDNGTTDGWDYTLGSVAFYEKYLKKYLVTTQKAGFNSLISFGIKYYWLNNVQVANGYELYTANRTVLNDGTFVYVGDAKNNHRDIYIDINGIKKPNKMGRDLFMFEIQPKYKFTSYGIGTTGYQIGTTMDRNKILNSGDVACSKEHRGHWCSTLIMLDGWRISDDYPW